MPPPPRHSRERFFAAIAGFPPRAVGRFHEHRGILLLVLGLLVLWLNNTFLIPLTMGTIFAVVLYPVIERMARWRVGRAWKAALVTVVFAFSFLLPLGAAIFLGAGQALLKIQEMQDSGIDANKLSSGTFINYFGFRPLISYLADISPVSESQIRAYASHGLSSLGAWAIKMSQDVLANLPGGMFSIFIILLTVFFLLIDGKRALRFLSENSFFNPNQTDKIFSAVSSLCYSVVVATIAAGGVQALLITVSCWITGTHAGILIGLVAFSLSFIPVVGTTPVTFSLLIHALVIHDSRAAAIFAAFVFLVPFAENFVRPYVLKGGASLHPLVGFVAAFGALDVLGFYGVFIGPVVAELFFTILPMVARSYRIPHKGQ